MSSERRQDPQGAASQDRSLHGDKVMAELVVRGGSSVQGFLSA
ncbi:MAG: hypothetical protein ACLQUW_02930 [Desulfobaccales bacterium]